MAEPTHSRGAKNDQRYHNTDRPRLTALGKFFEESSIVTSQYLRGSQDTIARREPWRWRDLEGCLKLPCTVRNESPLVP
jgi:hypothetical protein